MGTVITRILAGTGWVIVSWLLWAMSGNLLDFSVQYCDRHRIRIPFEIDLVLSFVVLSGILIIPPLTAVLAIRGKLPLTVSTKFKCGGTVWQSGAFARCRMGEAISQSRIQILRKDDLVLRALARQSN